LKASRSSPAGTLCGLALILALQPRLLPACDSSACLLVTRAQRGVLPKGVLRLDASFRRTD